MKFSELLSAVGLKPKDLEQARTALEPAKATLESVAEMFTQAGLDLDAMLTAGPDSLKAHLDTLKAADMALAKLEDENEQIKTQLAATETKVATYVAAFDAVGFKFGEKSDVKADFAEHIKKAAAVELAKAGHPPVPMVPENKPDAGQTDKELAAAWKAMPHGTERLQFFAKHEAAIRRASGFKH